MGSLFSVSMYNTGKVPDIDIVDEVGGFTASISSVHEKSVNATKKAANYFYGIYHNYYFRDKSNLYVASILDNGDLFSPESSTMSANALISDKNLVYITGYWQQVG